ncbi:helix-turn-helix transcriptional regulator [Sorangium cellulosum]|uniref:DNA-binding protein n=2 Tax=Sorangium cellulosum TaxID=56 RepID=A0A150S151_SORCE|nr:DNA-binding protein [Sorangium cellulosum]KYG08564.1 DNA-binding protein [Sorangium cellulosum]
MRRADRLFQILQILRRQRAPVTAAALAEELETSKRTVYRDVADLLAQRVPIRGEAGTGYVLERGFDMPPLMLTPDEIEVAVLGAQWVAHRGDAALRRAAQDLIAKIAATVPERLRPLVLEPTTGTPPALDQVPDGLDLAEVRASIRAGTKIALRYRDEAGRESERVVWPVVVGYRESTRLLVAWCEVRQDFRSFRTDRVVGATFLKERYGERPSALRARWRATLPARRELWKRTGAPRAGE